MAISSQSEYRYTKAILSIPEKGVEIDVVRSILELTIYESVRQPYLTARIIIADSERVIDKLKINGTERLELEIRNDQYDFTYSRKFMITRTEEKVKVSEQAYGYVFYLTEEVFVLDVLKKISRAYKGTPDQIIRNVLSSEFDKGMDLIGGAPTQAAFQYISPYVSPLEIIETIREKATTEAGFPFFVYATLKDNTIKMKSLAHVLSTDPINNVPFTYSAAQTSSSDAKRQLTAIQDWKYLGNNDTVEMVMKGAVQNQFNVLNLSTNQRNQKNRFNITDLIDANGNSIYNRDFKIDDKRLNDYDPNVVYRIVNHTTTDELGYHDERDIEKNSNRMKSHAIRQALTKHMISVTINGIPNWFDDVELLGNQIDVEILNTQTDPVDKVNSGSYVVLESRHVFVDQKYTQLLTCSKLSHSEKPSISVGPSGFPGGL